MSDIRDIDRIERIPSRGDTRGHEAGQYGGRRASVEQNISTQVEDNFCAEPTQGGYAEAFRRFCIRAICCGDRPQPEVELTAIRVGKPIGKAIDHCTDKGELIRAIKSFPKIPTRQQEDSYRAELGDGYTPICYADELPPSNCHSYTLTNCEGAIITSHGVNVTLRDNGYKQILTGRVGTAPDLSGLNSRRLQVGNIVIYYLDNMKETSKGYAYSAQDKSVGDEIEHTTVGADGRKNRDSDVVTATDRPFITHSGYVSRIENGKIYIISKHGNYGLYESEISEITQNYGLNYAMYYTKRKDGRFLKEK